MRSGSFAHNEQVRHEQKHDILGSPRFPEEVSVQQLETLVIEEVDVMETERQVQGSQPV